jgi:hypothetical protein
MKLAANLVTLAAIFGLAGTAAAGDGWGTLKGQIVLKGDLPVVAPLVSQEMLRAKGAELCVKQEIPDESLVFDSQTRGVANVFVYLESAPTRVHPDLKSPAPVAAVIRTSGCRFSPHALLARAGQTLDWYSEDGSTVHSVRLHSLSNPEPGCLLSPTPTKPGAPDRRWELKNADRLPSTLRCDIHPWMTGRVLVLDHPYAAISDSSGQFEIAQLPEGEHVFRVWHERRGYLIRDWRVTIEAGRATMAPAIEVTPEMLAGPMTPVAKKVAPENEANP